jgi:hypothetical protein
MAPQTAKSPAAAPEDIAVATRPSGPIAAVMLAVGIGSLVLAVLVIAAEASESFAQSLAYSDRVGPLSGKTIWSVVAFLVSWAVLAATIGRRNVDLRRVSIITAVMVGLALLGTFSPFFELFAPD